MQIAIGGGVSMQRDQIDRKRVTSATNCKVCETLARKALELCDEELTSLTMIGLILPAEGVKAGPTVMITGRKVRGEVLPPLPPHAPNCTAGPFSEGGHILRIGLAYDQEGQTAEIELMPIVGRVSAPVRGAKLPS